MKHLKFDMYGAVDSHVDDSPVFVKRIIDKPPKLVMKELGITYQYSTVHSLYEYWIFWNCENIPEQLSMVPFLKEAKINPMDAVGHGLLKGEVEAIRDYAKERERENNDENQRNN